MVRGDNHSADDGPLQAYRVSEYRLVGHCRRVSLARAVAVRMGSRDVDACDGVTSVINELVARCAWAIRIVDRQRRVRLVRRLGFASHMQPGIGGRVSDLEHLIPENDLLAVQEPDVTRILPSGWRSMMIVVLSDVAKRSRTFSSMSTPKTPRGLVRRRQAFENFFRNVWTDQGGGKRRSRVTSS